MVFGSEALENKPEDQLRDGSSGVFVGSKSRVIVAALASPSRLTLGISFVGAFLFATVGFILAGHYFLGAPRSLLLLQATLDPQGDALFSKPLVVSSQGIYQKVSAREELNPIAGSDFLVFVWFRLKRIPVTGESMSLVGKFDSQLPHKPGFAISLEGAPDGVRPRVYWNNAAGQGRWYSFTSRAIKRKEWYLLGVSYSRDTFLAAHMLDGSGGQRTTSLLGGHRIDPSFAATSQAGMVLGAYGASRFRGQLGPFGVLRGASLERDIPDYLSAMSEAPSEIPSVIPSSTIQLWASPFEDRGPHHITLEAVEVASPKKERELVMDESSPKPAPKTGALKRVKKNVKSKRSSRTKR